MKPELLFLGTEFGVYFSADGGGRWTKLGGGVPTISFRDLAIQRRDDDLVGATFGRGFYVFDDIRVFREVTDEKLAAPGTLFSTRKAWWYVPRPHLSFSGGKGDQGASYFVAPNPPFGAVFTYHLGRDLETRRKARQREEKAAAKGERAATFPGWEAIDAERREPEPRVWLTVKDSQGRVVRRIAGPTTKGFHRVAWDLRFPPPHAVKLVEPPPPLWGGPPQGLMVAPGRYEVSLASQVDGKVTPLSEPQSFDVVPLRKGTLPAPDPSEVATFWRSYEDAVRVHSAMQIQLTGVITKLKRMGKVIANSRVEAGRFDGRYHELRVTVLEIDDALNGNGSRRQPGEKTRPTIQDRLSAVSRGLERSTRGPTKTHRRSLEIARADIDRLRDHVSEAQTRTSALVRDLIEAGAPWIEGESTLPPGK